MPSHLLKIPALLLLCSLCACQSSRHSIASPPPAEPGTTGKSAADLQTRNNALALLDDLLNDEKNLSKLLIVKRNSDELGRLVENISKTAGKGADLLQTIAKNEPGLDLKKTDLPPGEAATRKAISKTKEHVLLHSKNAEFEFQLLLTQVEGLNYGAHLAMVAAENEPQASRTREFLALGEQLRNLHEQVLAMVRARR
jgi:hypothetical protein